MADTAGGVEMTPPILNLTPEEKRVFGQLFTQADTDKIGVVTGEVAVKFFERTKLAPSVLGEIWQIADTENRGLLTFPGFCMVLRLIGHYQAGRDPTPDLAFRPGPLPKFEGLNLPAPASVPAPPAAPAGLQPQTSGPIRVPPLTPDKAAEYATLFEKSGAQNGILSGETAKQIFEKARLPNDVLGRIWNLADTEQRGALIVTEFIIAMHLLASYKSRALQALPSTLPPGLYEAAARRAQPAGRISGSPWPGDANAVPRQFNGSGTQRTESPMARPPFGTPPQSAQPTGGDWLINAKEKATYDSFFSKLDVQNRGYITGEQAVLFFSDSSLPEDVLAAIWDLADINSEGQLNRDEFAVAMFLIRQQRGKGAPPLPTALPPALVPPSMRNQPRPAPQTTAPAFDNAAYSSQLSKSASEDLFGLDAFSAPAPAQTQQSTGGSASYGRPFGSDAFNSKTTSPVSSQGFPPVPRTQSSSLKPFTPTSAFGQNLTTQGTGSPADSQSQSQSRGNQQSSAMDDLLGDNDPEVSKKLTQETTELANMSNQIGTLRTQMEEVQSKKVATEGNLGNVGTQRRDLELRLSQFRSQYEQEVKHVKALEDRLAASRNETRKLQQDVAMIEGSYQDLQNQHRQVAMALDADQRENASLKERIRQVNNEVNALRPQLDKMRSDSRQQKGMVAINKKQLSTNEGERDRMRSEMKDLNKSTQDVSQSASSMGQDSGAASVASPSSQSTNPFFRKSPQPSADNTMSPSGFARDNPPSQGQMGFDNFLGSAYQQGQSGGPPSSSYRSDPNTPAFSVPSGQSVRSSEPDVPTPSTSPPLSSYHESPRNADYPGLSDSRMMASGGLPPRNDVSRTDSYGSSANFPAPPSKYEPSGADTPTLSSSQTGANFDRDASRNMGRTDTYKSEPGSTGSALFDGHGTTSPAPSATSEATRSGLKTDDHRDAFQNFNPMQKDTPIPGAFPSDINSQIESTPTGESALSDRSKTSTRQSEGFPSNRSDPFSGNKDQARGVGAAKVDFDAAFAGFGPGRQLDERQNTAGSANGSVDSGAANKFNKEFPPIEDLTRDDDSESNSEHGFSDNFTSASPQPKTGGMSQAQSGYPRQAPATESSSDDLYKPRPPMGHADSTASGQLPPAADAQKSPPTYDQTVSPSGSRSGGRDSNQFPPEFTGLLPSRQDPTSQNQAPQSPDKTFSPSMAGGQGQALFGGSNASKAPSSAPQTIFSASPPAADTPVSTVPSDAYHSAVSYPSAGADKAQSPTSQPPPVQKSAFGDDFDTGFEDLSEAKEADEKGDEDFMIGGGSREGLDEFNPVFDSPAASKSNTMASLQTPVGKPGHPEDSFSDFEQISQGYGQPKPQQQQQQQPGTSSSHDWDAIFSGLDSSHPDRSMREGESGESSSKAAAFPAPDERNAQEDKMPKLGRALSAGTEHDDPILKKLTGMGYSRPDALSALEKFDYDINKAADYLTSGQ